MRQLYSRTVSTEPQRVGVTLVTGYLQGDKCRCGLITLELWPPARQLMNWSERNNQLKLKQQRRSGVEGSLRNIAPE